MTKSQQIMDLYDGKRTTAEIAKIVGCRPEYVRVVARQRKGSGASDIDRRYRASPLGKESQRRQNIKWRGPLKASIEAYMQVVRETGSRPQAQKAARVAYRAARDQGKSTDEAKVMATRAYQRKLRSTADRRRARAASRDNYRAATTSLEAAE